MTYVSVNQLIVAETECKELLRANELTCFLDSVH